MLGDVLSFGTARKATMLVAAAGIAFGSAAFSGCGSDSEGGAPAPAPQEAMKKSMNASGDFYKKQHKSAPKNSASKSPAPKDPAPQKD